MKTILALWHVGDKGKTETLREFAKILLSMYPNFRPIFPMPTTISATSDFRLVVEINGKIVGIESQGDPNTDLENRLIDLADNFQCEIILCASRTKGETVAAVDNISLTRSFQTIWTSTYQIADKANHNLLNRLKAKHLLDILNGLNLI